MATPTTMSKASEAASARPAAHKPSLISQETAGDAGVAGAAGLGVASGGWGGRGVIGLWWSLARIANVQLIIKIQRQSACGILIF